MAGPGRITPGVSTPGEDVQLKETDEPLAWQGELDVAIDDIDSRLKHPRRRVTDLLKREGALQAPGTAVAAAISKTVAAASPRAAQPAPPPLPEPKRLPHGIAMTIRIRRPFFRLPWPFRRRKRQAMIMFSDYRIS